MKIAVVVRNLTRAGGGLEQHALHLVRGLARRGHEVHVFAQTWDTPEEAPKEPAIQFHQVPAIRRPAWLQALTFHWNVNRRLVRDDYEIVLGTGLVLFAPQQIYRLSGGLVDESLRLRHPNPLARGLMLLLRPVYLVNWWLERRLMAGRVEHLIANSSQYRDHAVRRYGIPADQADVVYNGYDPERFSVRRAAALRSAMRRKHGLPDDAMAVLFVAHNFNLKGLDVLLAAMPAVLRKQPKSRLIVVGKDRASRFRRRAARLGIDRRVLFLGATERVEECYAMADVFALPTRYDPFANVCLEAMACGLPVVTTRINGASELIRDGESGYVLNDPGDAAALSDRLCRLLSPKHRTAMGCRAAEAAAPYTQARHLAEIERVFDEVRERAEPARSLRRSLKPLEGGMIINGAYEELLQRHGLDRFETLMGYEEGTPIKARPGKRIFQMRLEDDGAPVVFYLKRHRLPLTWVQQLQWRLGRRPPTEGRKEWEQILLCHDARVPTVTPVAAGERIVGSGVQESFVLTVGLQHYSSLEWLLPKRFVSPLTRELLGEKRRLIRTVAELMLRLHWAGLYHRDFYLAHLLLHKDFADPPDLRLIDLQRMLVRPWLASRWRVKDVASIYYHARHIAPGNFLLSRTDAHRFLTVYRPAWTRHRRFLRAVDRKMERIARHVRHVSRSTR